MVPDWLAGGRSRVTWPAGLFPSPAELNSFSALWLVPVWAGTAEWYPSLGPAPWLPVGAGAVGQSLVVGRRRAAAARGALVKFGAWRAFGWAALAES